MVATHAAASNGAAPHDPFDLALAALEAVGGPDDGRPEADVLDDIDSRAAAVQALLANEASARRLRGIRQDIARLREDALAGPDALGALRTKVGEAKRALGLDRPKLPDPAEAALALISAPADGHAPAGLETLDAITEGGWCSEKFHVIAGEPNVGKTSLAVQFARFAVEDGWIVGFHVADVDDRKGIMMRVAQAHGLDRKAFKARDPVVLKQTAAIMARWRPRFAIVDEAADGKTIDDTAEALLVLAGIEDRRPALFVDSLQTIQLRWPDGREPRTDKDRIDQVVKRLVLWTRRGLTVVATCEIPRGFYTGPKKTKGPRQAPPALAAFKGSGNIEYAAWTALVITRIRGESDAVRVEVPKNKQGREDVTFKLVRTESRVGYEDAGELYEQAGRDDAGASGPEPQSAFDVKIERAAEQLLPILEEKLRAAGAAGLTARQVRERIVGKNLAKDRAIEKAVERKTAEVRTVKGFDRFFLAGEAPAVPVPEVPDAAVDLSDV